MKTILITKLEELLLKEVGEVAADVRTLQKEYQKLWTSEFENAKQVFIDDGGRAKEFEFPKQTNDIKFEGLLEKYSKLKKEADLKIASEQAKNLIIRQEIVGRIFRRHAALNGKSVDLHRILRRNSNFVMRQR